MLELSKAVQRVIDVERKACEELRDELAATKAALASTEGALSAKVSSLVESVPQGSHTLPLHSTVMREKLRLLKFSAWSCDAQLYPLWLAECLLGSQDVKGKSNAIAGGTEE